MKNSVIAIAMAAGLVFVCFSSSEGQDVRSRARRPQETSKSSDKGVTEIDVDIGAVFSGEYGETVTDENGTFYNVFGCSFFADKVYPPEYWGVFPLYFFDTQVGVTMSVQNNSPDTSVKVRLRQEAFCIRVDGSSGAELTDPSQDDVSVNGGETAVFDASFLAYYTPYAEEGLDRLVIGVYKPDSIDENNGDHTLAGAIDISPNNNQAAEFVMTLPDGTMLSRDNLRDDYVGYDGPARRVHLKPKGNGADGLIVDGQPYPLVKSKTYDLMSGSMTVSITKPMGQWTLGVNGSGATILTLDDGNAPVLTKEAVFCPPDVNGAAAELAKSVMGGN